MTDENPTQALTRLQDSRPGEGDPLIQQWRSAPPKIRSIVEAEDAARIKNEAQARIDALEKAIEPHVKAAYDLHRQLVDERKAQTAPYREIVEDRSSALDEYREEQERAAKEAAAAEAERVAAAAKAERERLIREARARGQTKREAEAAARAAVDSDILTARAKVETAAAPKIAGAPARKRWIGKVTDVRLLCRIIADGELPTALIEVKQAELNRLASTWRDSKEFPGLRFRQVTKTTKG